MTRADWQELAEERLLAVQALLTAQLWSSAYYLAGYAVEFGLKSCILVRVAATPELIFLEGNKKFSENCWVHDIEKLVKLAGLKQSRDADIQNNTILGTNWGRVQAWDEKSRYRMKTQPDAQQLYDAIADPVNGVMQWIRVRW